MDRVSYEVVQRRAEIGSELASGVDTFVLKWYGHMERMNEQCVAGRGLTKTCGRRMKDGSNLFLQMTWPAAVA